MFAKELDTTGGEPPVMLDRPKSGRGPNLHGAQSVIGSDLTVKGNLFCDGSIQIDGRVEGNIECKSLIVGENGDVRGVVTATSVMICGNLEGEVTAESVQLMSHGTVTGDIIHKSLSVEAGASIEGNLRRKVVEDPLKPKPSAEPAKLVTHEGMAVEGRDGSTAPAD
jgi:cytoskeletal protein CcmA (bactofilin family)